MLIKHHLIPQSEDNPYMQFRVTEQEAFPPEKTEWPNTEYERFLLDAYDAGLGR